MSEPYEVLPHKPNTPGWLQARKTGLGGSDAGPVLGLSKWRTPLQVWQDKTGQEIVPQDQTEDQRWGHLKEPLILQEYGRRMNAVLGLPLMLRSREHPWMLASVDAVAMPPQGPVIVVDAKSHRHDDGYGREGTDEVPAEYAAQAHHYMAVSGVRRVDFAVLFGSADFRIYTVLDDPAVRDGLIESEREFWAKVLEKTPPAPRTAEDAAILFPRSKPGLVCQADEVVVEMANKLRSMRSERTSLDSLIEEAELALKTRMGEADVLAYRDLVLATWKSSKPRERLDTDAIERDHPGLLKKYTVDGKAARPFLLKGAKE